MKQEKPVFVYTNIPVDILRDISDEKQFIYQLLMKEKTSGSNGYFRECLKRVNSTESYIHFIQAGFCAILREDNRIVEETLHLAERIFGLDKKCEKGEKSNSL